MRAFPCVLDYEHFSVFLCSGDGFSDVLAAYDSRVLTVGVSFAGFCLSFAMHNKFLVTVVAAMEFVESVCRWCRFRRLRLWRLWPRSHSCSSLRKRCDPRGPDGPAHPDV